MYMTALALVVGCQGVEALAWQRLLLHTPFSVVSCLQHCDNISCSHVIPGINPEQLSRQVSSQGGLWQACRT